MKKFFTALVTLCLIFTALSACFAQESPQSYMGISVTSPFYIFTKNMQDEELLASIGKSAEDINKILDDTGSEALIINSETGAQTYLKILKNDLSYELWNISQVENDYITENLKTILYDGFSMNGLNYQDENVNIDDYAYMKFITVWGSAFNGEGAQGVVCGGSVVNGNALVFTMLTEKETPTQEETESLKALASSVSFTVIKDKGDSLQAGTKAEEKDVFNYILGGFGAIVLIIFCVYMIARMKMKDEDNQETENSEERKDKSE